MRAQCFSAPVQRRYYAGTGSLPHLLSLALLLVTVFVPLFLAHGSRGFWPTTNTYTEQPHVQLTYQVITVLEGERIDADGTKHYVRMMPNSLPTRVQRLLENEMRPAQIKAYETDTNRDGVPESLHVQVVTPLESGEAIYQVKAFVFLNYTLMSHVKLSMDAMAVVMYASPLPGSAFVADGDLQLRMRSPARISHETQTPFAAKPLLNVAKILGARDLDLNAIVSRYRARDWHTQFDVPYPLWTTDVASTTQSTAVTARRTFQLSLTIRLPPVSVLYRPTWSELLKTAWIQYFALLIIVYGLVQGVLGVLFKNRILDTYTMLDDPLVLTKKQH